MAEQTQPKVLDQTMQTLDQVTPDLTFEIGEAAKEEAHRMQSKKKKNAAVSGLLTTINDALSIFSTVTLKDRVLFFQLLSVMLNAGVPLIRSLAELERESKNPRMRTVIKDLRLQVENGKRLADALEAHPEVFDSSNVGMIRSGEASGQLTNIMKDISVQMEKTSSLQSKIKNAMMYPIMVFGMLGVAMFVMMAFVVPKLMMLFTSTGVKLPFATRALIAVSGFVSTWWMAIGLFFIIGIGFVWFWGKTPPGKYLLHRLQLFLPVFGDLFKKVALARFHRIFAGLMKSGIGVVQAIEIAGNAVGNEVYRRRFLLASEDVGSGITFAETLAGDDSLFPGMVVSMLAIGEQSAEIDTVANKVADFYEEEVDSITKNLTKIMEPIVLGVMGLAVGGLIAAIIQPIIELTDLAGNL